MKFLGNMDIPLRQMLSDTRYISALICGKDIVLSCMPNFLQNNAQQNITKEIENINM